MEVRHWQRARRVAAGVAALRAGLVVRVVRLAGAALVTASVSGPVAILAAAGRAPIPGRGPPGAARMLQRPGVAVVRVVVVAVPPAGRLLARGPALGAVLMAGGIGLVPGQAAAAARPAGSCGPAGVVFFSVLPAWILVVPATAIAAAGPHRLLMVVPTPQPDAQEDSDEDHNDDGCEANHQQQLHSTTQ